MKRTLFYLSTCSTCTRIIKEIQPDKTFKMQDIKTEPITGEQLDEMAKMSGSYEALFSRKAIKYRSLGFNEKRLSQRDFRKLILEEYTFLKRPVFVIDDEIFIGNASSTVEAIKKKLKK